LPYVCVRLFLVAKGHLLGRTIHFQWRSRDEVLEMTVFGSL
jgi:hypothetical protein